MKEIKAFVTYQGARRYPALALPRVDRDRDFSRRHPVVEIHLDNKKGYAPLQPSFFGEVPQIRTIYESPKGSTKNLLREWISKHEIRFGVIVRLEVIERYKSFRLKI